MKKVLLVTAALLLISGSGAAVVCPNISLFADADRKICEAHNPGGFYPFEMWVWVMPPSDSLGYEYPGMMRTEFMLVYPANIIRNTVTWNEPIISVTLGDLPGGLSVSYVACRYGWTWICHQLCYLTDTTAGFIQLAPHPDAIPSPRILIAQCREGMPAMDITVFNHLALNQPCVVGTEESSRGAIKSVFGE